MTAEFWFPTSPLEHTLSSFPNSGIAQIVVASDECVGSTIAGNKAEIPLMSIH